MKKSQAQKDLTFKRIIDGEKDPIKKDLLKSLLLTEEDLSQEDFMGTFTADLKANIHVFAPVMAMGITDKITLAIAVPYYDVSTDARVGFNPNNRTAAKFLGLLTSPSLNQPAEANEAWGKINNAVGELQQKLTDNGFQNIGTWREQGFGDITLAVKQLAYNPGPYAIAATYGLVLPTGRRDDPDILTDLPFGDGQTDAFFQVTADEFLPYGVVLNQYAKYTYQAPGHRTIRMATLEEKIQVDKAEADFKLGDKIDAGAAVLHETFSGIGTGLGVVYFRKFADKYDVPTEVRQELEKYSDQELISAEAQLGYSTVAAFQRGDFAIPFSVALNYKRHLSSKNQPVTDLITVDMNMYF